METGEIDMMVDVAYTPERAKIFTFQKETTLLSWSRMYTRKGTYLQTIFDLEGKKIAGLKGSYNLDGPEGLKDMLTKFNINCEIIEMKSYAVVFEALDQDRVFAGVTNKDFGSRFENEYSVERTPIIFQPASLLFAFPLNSEFTPELIKKIDNYVIKLKENKDSIYYTSLDKYLGGLKNITIFPFWLKVTIAVILSVILIFMFFIWILKYEVNQKTQELRLYIYKLKKAEENLINYRDQLEILVENRTVELKSVNTELQIANLRLEEASKLKSQFLANMSHELRSPLNSIIGFTGIMIQGLSGELNEEQKKQLGMVYESARHLLSLINDILDLSKIEAGKIKIFFEDMEISTLISMVYKMISPLAEEKGLIIKTELAGNLPEVICNDRNRIKQVLINLVANSIKFTEKGEITIAGNFLEDENAILFSVQDTGIGIKEEDQETIFEEFTQLETVKKTKPEGTGLGLAISQKLVRMMGGKIWVESQFGKGAKFYFTIPITFTQEKNESLLDPGKKLILTIDDEVQSQEILKTYLTEAGYQVMQAYNFQDSMKLACKYNPFAITLDMVMPGKDGWEILEQLKLNQLTKNIPVICISILDNRELGISLGAVEYLVKPINSEQLLSELQRLEKQFQIQNILIIDDNHKDVTLLNEYLKEYKNYKLTNAYSGAEGLRKIKGQIPDLIILDLMMPDMDGFEVIRHLKDQDETKNIPTIIVSAKVLDKDEQNFLNTKIEGIIHKGEFKREKLLNDIVSFIKRIEKTREV